MSELPIELPECPFCDFQAITGEYELLLHLETLHTEGESPFIAADPIDDSASKEACVECPIEECDDIVLARGLGDHLQLHAARDDPCQTESKSREMCTEHPVSGEGLASPSAMHTSPAGSMKNAQVWWPLLFARRQKASSRNDGSGGSSTPTVAHAKLGKSELGRFANEDRMPQWLATLLHQKSGVQAAGVIPVLEQLVRQSRSTECAYLCHPSVVHISKLRREGGFCGYRNIQMLTSYLAGVGSNSSLPFGTGLPTIFQIQDLVERAWDMGINAQGRAETGGIKGTRKYIGTPEAQAFFVSLGIPCEVQAFRDPAPGKSHTLLLKAVEEYFRAGCSSSKEKVTCTSLPPIYYQHAGHSLTIIGIERQQHSRLNLLVFDPMFHDSTNVTKFIGKTFDHKGPDSLLKAYRRGVKYLAKHTEFEILRLVPRMDVDAADRAAA